MLSTFKHHREYLQKMIRYKSNSTSAAAPRNEKHLFSFIYSGTLSFDAVSGFPVRVCFLNQLPAGMAEVHGNLATFYQGYLGPASRKEQSMLVRCLLL